MCRHPSRKVLQVLAVGIAFVFSAPIPGRAVDWLWNGYFVSNFTGDTRAASRDAFDNFALSLIPQAIITDNTSIYTQIVFEHGPFHDIKIDGSGNRSLDRRSVGELAVNDAYLKYAWREWLAFRLGKFATPYGLYNTLIYADPAYVTARSPGRDTFYSRGDEPRLDANFVQRYSVGAWAAGSWKALSYDFYVTNGRTQLAQHVDDNGNKAVGGRLGTSIPQPLFEKLKVTYSAYHDTTSTATIASAFQSNTTHAGALELGFKSLELIAEYANGARGGTRMEAYYGLVSYTVAKRFTPFVRYEALEPNRAAGSDRTFVTGGGVRVVFMPDQIFTTNMKLQLDRVTSDNTAPSSNYNRYFVTVGAGF